MSAQLIRMLGPLGGELLETVSAADHPMTVREVLDKVNRRRAEPLAYTTVMTVLARLAEQDVLRRTLIGRGYVYVAAVADAADLAVRSLIREHGEAAVAHFVEHVSMEPKLRSRLEALVRSGDRATA